MLKIRVYFNRFLVKRIRLVSLELLAQAIRLTDAIGGAQGASGQRLDAGGFQAGFRGGGGEVGALFRFQTPPLDFRGGLRVVLLQQRFAQVDLRFLKIGLAFQRLPKRRLRLRKFSPRKQGAAQIVVEFRQFRRQIEREPKARFRLFRLPQRVERQSQPGMRFHRRRVLLQSPVVQRNRLFVLPLIGVQGSQPEKRLLVVGLRLQQPQIQRLRLL